jgi:hypothetical protein
MNWFRWLFDWWRRLLEWIREWFASHSGGGGTIADDKCCGLARLDHECQWIGSKSKYTCPSGYYRQWWYCCEGTQQIACGECTPSPSTCWSGPWECSIWWYTGATC